MYYNDKDAAACEGESIGELPQRQEEKHNTRIEQLRIVDQSRIVH